MQYFERLKRGTEAFMNLLKYLYSFNIFLLTL